MNTVIRIMFSLITVYNIIIIIDLQNRIHVYRKKDLEMVVDCACVLGVKG